MTAVYSDLLFDDRSLYDDALAAQRRYDCTLLTALDLPWVADGHMRDGEHVRVPVDTRVRAALQCAGIGHAVIGGHGDARVAAALAAVHAARRPRAAAGGWRWLCEHCDDGSCERHAAALFTSLHGR
jgi:nicotinamide riboside kinase